MYCHLCHVEASPTHGSSSEHRAARQLVAVAIGRLSNYLAASEDSAKDTTNAAEADKSVKTPEAVSFCDSCNVVVPITEHALHLRRKDHALALLSEQTFKELVDAYVGEDPKLEPTELTDEGAFVDETEAVNTYTCNICDIKVPQVFKPEHERGSRHHTSRRLTLAASRRARDSISASQSDGHKGHTFTGKMIKKLLKAYTGGSGGYDEDKTEIAEAETEPTKEPKRLTAKEYFTDILPVLPYIGSFYTLIIDNTEFVTIQIGNETVKIHVNNLNGLCNVDMNGGYYTACRLCDGFGNTYYSRLGQQDKCHVMSLGHIKNVLSPIDSVHLIRKIDELHSICGLCNVHFNSQLVDNHILKDTRHSMALSEALDKGKEYKESKEHLKIRIYMPPPQKQNIFMKPNQFNNNQNRWTFGVPQPRQCSGTLFGITQNTGFGSAQNTGLSSTQTFGSAQNTCFGSAQNTSIGSAQNTGFGSAQNTGFGSAQNTSIGSAQNTGFGSAQNTGFGSAQNTSIGSAQNTGFGSAQNSVFGSAQNTGFGTAQNTGFGSAQNTGFGSAQASFGVSQTKVQTSAFCNVSTQQNTTAFGSAQNTNFCAQNKGQNSAINNGSTQNTTAFGTAQSSTGFFGNSQTSATGFGANNKKTLFGNVQNNTPTFGAAQPGQGNAQPHPVNSGVSQSNTVFGSAQNATSPFGNAQIKDGLDVKTAVATDQTNKSSTPNNWAFGQVKDPNPPAGLLSQSHANGGNSQQNNDFANAQSPSQNKGGNESEQDKKNFGDAQAQSINVDDAQTNKPAVGFPPVKQKNCHLLSSSSDSE